ncbi:hypothetical protein AMTR_s00010p00266510 [Amborella trichopoda]|uniref:AB hydrolase-1 domain-containing protein n=1 Tax=Amborella trichopoda TaxID=13333 RepID=W1NH70_AMBTC|nr:hypothetical protein AMTR_s00010p00266510 [Amborella trichopoda]
MHCWVPKNPNNNHSSNTNRSKPSLVLLHGFGANAMWQWSEHLRPLMAHFDVYVPDLVFFGESYTTGTERNEQFQARCVGHLMSSLGVTRFSLIGISYGGFVAYWVASMSLVTVEKLVLCCAGVCLEEKDLVEGFFRVNDLEEATSILLPQTPEKLRELVRMSFYRPKVMPSCFLSDFIDVMCTEQIQEKKELIEALITGRKLSNLPKITQVFL